VKARVLVYPRREVLDPQAKAIHQALARLGFDEVVEVHAGKAFELEVKGRNPEGRLRAMCDQLLANPIMERYAIELLPTAAQTAKAAAGRAKGDTQVPGDADPTGGTAGGKPVPAKSPGTTPKATPPKAPGGKASSKAAARADSTKSAAHDRAAGKKGTSR
jgi:phosphoribosylformylglycinamidine synthase PurS subunit